MILKHLCRRFAHIPPLASPPKTITQRRKAPLGTPLTDMLHLTTLLDPPPQLRLEHAPKQLQQHLEADLCHGRVVAAFAQLVADEGVLRPGELVPAEDAAGLAQLAAEEVAPGVGHVGVAHAEDERGLGPEGAEVVERVGAVGRGVRGGVRVGVGAEGAGVDVCWEVGCCGGDAGVELGDGAC